MSSSACRPFPTKFELCTLFELVFTTIASNFSAGLAEVSVGAHERLSNAVSLVATKRRRLLKRHGILYLGAVVALFFVGLGVSAQKITTSYQHDFDFGNHRRYAWGQNHVLTRQGRPNDAIIEQKIVQNVNRILAAKGFTEDRTNPDFFVSFDAGAPASNGGFEAPPPPPGPVTPLNPFPGVPQEMWYSVNGVIAFHVTAAKSNQAMWSALAKKKVRDPQKAMKNLDQEVREFVDRAFKSFPPGRK
jgi:hypothetical protein